MASIAIAYKAVWSLLRDKQPGFSKIFELLPKLSVLLGVPDELQNVTLVKSTGD